jgi:hypothetical protein
MSTPQQTNINQQTPAGGYPVPSVHSGAPQFGTGANVVHDAPIVKKDIVREHPEIVHHEHHVQPVIHEKERHIQPVHKTEITTEHPVLHKETIVQEPARMETAGLGVAEPHHHVGIGQKLKGTMKEVQGAITRNPALKEEGKLMKQGASTTGTTHY